MNEWYSELGPEEMTGKHVRVQFDNGIVFEGPLVYDELNDFVRLGPMRNVPCTEGLPVEETGTPPVLTRSSDGHWHPFSDVKSIELVWDEHDWKQLEPDDAEIADAAIINAQMLRVMYDGEDNTIWLEKNDSATINVDQTMVSAFLLSKWTVPDQPGAYMDRHGDIWFKPRTNALWQTTNPNLKLGSRTDKEMKILLPLKPMRVELKGPIQ